MTSSDKKFNWCSSIIYRYACSRWLQLLLITYLQPPTNWLFSYILSVFLQYAYILEKKY